MPFNKLRIHAIIPDGQTPESVLVGPDGNHPSEIFDPTRHHTLEGVVHSIGRSIGARALSVAMRRKNAPEGGIVYETDKVPRDELTLPEGYTWQPASKEGA